MIPGVRRHARSPRHGVEAMARYSASLWRRFDPLSRPRRTLKPTVPEGTNRQVKAAVAVEGAGPCSRQVPQRMGNEPTSGDAALIIVEGTWSLPPRRQ
jgi:hypothetical protein